MHIHIVTDQEIDHKYSLEQRGWCLNWGVCRDYTNMYEKCIIALE